MAKVVAGVLREFGTKEAMIVRGRDGIDEFSITSPTDVVHLKNKKISSFSLSPKDFGIKFSKIASLKNLVAKDKRRSSEVILEVLNGEKNSARDIVLINSAAAIKHSGMVKSYKEGVALAANAIDSGGAMRVLNSMKESNK